MADATKEMLLEVALRIRELRIDSGFSEAEMAEKTGLSLERYRAYEAAETDLPFTFIHKCALILGVEMMELLEGQTPHLTGYAVTRRGGGQLTAREPGIEIRSIAPNFRDRKADPYWVRYEYSEEEQRRPIAQVTHDGQEFDLVIEGRMKIKVGEHTEVLGPGDSIFYNSSTPHGIIAVDGADVVFLAMILSEDGAETEWDHGHPKSAVAVEPVRSSSAAADAPEYLADFLRIITDENGTPSRVRTANAERFNFAFDVVDAIAEREPEKLAMLHLDREKRERRFTFEDMRKMSARAANYFRALGVKKGDRVMLVLRRNWEFWPIIIGLHKLGAVAIPATDQLLEKD
ncbi:MAG: AMP-binding protein, partial [Oscillospiraceae bacterium]|nr:AMP-binding protein [Oscillospiraceae bacterium]